MPKILLFRAARDLSARLVSELSRAGYDIVAPESADVHTVLQHQPDLILLQTDVRTLDCCGLLIQLKGNEATAPAKIILLAEGGPLERSRALDLGADDVLRTGCSRSYRPYTAAIALLPRPRGSLRIAFSSSPTWVNSALRLCVSTCSSRSRSGLSATGKRL